MALRRGGKVDETEENEEEEAEEANVDELPQMGEWLFLVFFLPLAFGLNEQLP